MSQALQPPPKAQSVSLGSGRRVHVRRQSAPEVDLLDGAFLLLNFALSAHVVPLCLLDSVRALSNAKFEGADHHVVAQPSKQPSALSPPKVALDPVSPALGLFVSPAPSVLSLSCTN
jgi:hypothetical protein